MDDAYNADDLDNRDSDEIEQVVESGGLVLAYPNPASNALSLFYEEHISEIKSLTLFDMNGRKMRDVELSDSGYSHLDVSKFSPGLYVLKINGTMAMRIALTR